MPQYKNLNWKILFNSLLGNQQLDYTLSVSDGKIKIKADPETAEKIHKKITTALQTPASFRNSLPYKFSSPEADNQLSDEIKKLSITDEQSIPHHVEPPSDDFATAKKILLNLFGKKTFSTAGISLDVLFDTDEGAAIIDGVSYSLSTNEASATEIWQKLLDHLLKRFENIDLATIRAAYLGADNLPPLPKPESELSKEQKKESGIVRGLIQQCFGIYKTVDPYSAKLFFNHRRLYEFLFPPAVEMQIQSQQDANSTELHIDQEHLASYIQQLLQGGVFLRVYKSSDEANALFARPIFMGRETTIRKPLKFIILIDRSDSLSHYFDDLKKAVFTLIQ